MTNKPVTYPLHEGSFLTLSPDADYSINILKFTDAENNPYEVIINRAELTEDQTVDDFFVMQQERMQRFAPGYAPQGEEIRHEIGPSKLPVLQAANKYMHEGEWTHQVLSIIKLPFDPLLNPDQRKLVIFALASPNEFTDAQRSHYVRIINSFNPAQSSLSASGSAA